MLGEATPIDCSVVELQIFDLDGQNEVEMPKVYSTPRLPIRKECIGNQKDVDRWSHLTGIKIPHIDADIGLLIGNDAPEILQPSVGTTSKFPQRILYKPTMPFADSLKNSVTMSLKMSLAIRSLLCHKKIGER